MPRKSIKTDGFGSANENTYKYKRKPPAPYKEPQFLRDLRLNREKHFWLNNVRDRKDIEDYVNHMKDNWRKQDEQKT